MEIKKLVKKILGSNIFKLDFIILIKVNLQIYMYYIISIKRIVLCQELNIIVIIVLCHELRSKVRFYFLQAEEFS